MKKILSAPLCLCGSILLLALTLGAQTKDFTRWVNPFIGTGGHGHTFPGATLPFGMVQLSPATPTTNWAGSSGFSHTHLSGTGIPDGCDILFMPFDGTKEVHYYWKGPTPSKFSHVAENA